MSVPASTTARALEETFAPILFAGLASDIDLRKRQEAERKKLPAVILSAEETGDFLGVKVAGHVAKVCSLEIECRVDGRPVDSPAALEALAGSIEAIFVAAAQKVAAVRAAQETEDEEAEAAAMAALTAAGAARLLTGWLYLRFIDVTKESDFDGLVRTHTSTFELHALTAS